MIRAAKVVVPSCRDGGAFRQAIKQLLEHAAVATAQGGGDKVFLKPNLSYPVFTPGVATSVAFIESVAEYLLHKGCPVTTGEGPGGYNGCSMRVMAL